LSSPASASSTASAADAQTAPKPRRKKKKGPAQQPESLTWLWFSLVGAAGVAAFARHKYSEHEKEKKLTELDESMVSARMMEVSGECVLCAAHTCTCI
jgi:hypothetical protein